MRISATTGVDGDPPRTPAVAFIVALALLLSAGSARAQESQGGAKPPTEAEPQPQVRMLGSPVLTRVSWREGTGEASIKLRNDGKGDAVCLLAATVAGASKSSQTTITFPSDEDGTGVEGEVVLRAGATVPIRLAVAHAFDPNESEASLKCEGGGEIGRLKLFRAPFNITTANGQTDPIELSLFDQQAVRIPLKNDDPVPYPLAWKLLVDGQQIGAADITAQPKGLAIVEWEPQVPFRVHDLFKRIPRNGELLLFDGHLKDHNAAAPVKSFPIKATLSYFNASFRDGVSYVVVVLLLILGGISSLVLTHALPTAPAS